MLNILTNFEIFHSKIKIYLTSNVEMGEIFLRCTKQDEKNLVLTRNLFYPIF